MSASQELRPPTRILLGPGPANVHPRVLQAGLAPLVGYLDPTFVDLMRRTAEMLRPVFGTANEVTFPLSGTGHAGMEAGFISLLEPGDKVVVGVNGFFGQRIVEVARRAGGHVIPVEGEWGRVLDPDAFARVLQAQAPVKAIVIVHAETSTGVLQPLEPFARLAQQYEALFMVDAVTSLGGIEVGVDAHGIDYGYSCTQKCLGSLPGMAPISMSERARQTMAARQTGVGSWYLDVAEAWKYWSDKPSYHHTGPITMVYALLEALRLVEEEGLVARYRRHQLNGDALQAGLEAMGLKLVVPAEHRLSMLTTVQIPEGVDDARVRAALLEEFNLEIGGGLGALRGKAWRIGLMGHSSQPSNVLLLLSALGRVLRREGVSLALGEGEAAADRVYAAASATEPALARG